MKQKAELNIKRNVTHFFGSFGYLFCFLQWFWAIILYFSVIQSAALLVAPKVSEQTEQPQNLTFAPPSSVEIIITAVVVAVMIVVTIYALMRIPVSIVKTGNKIVHRTAETMTPVVMKAQHKKDTKKNHTKLTFKLVLIIKLLLVATPVALTACSKLLEKQAIDYSLAMIIGLALACLAIVLFAIQYAFAGILRVKTSDLW
jgi:hypothetical protein